jgi:hypothetical protein
LFEQPRDHYLASSSHLPARGTVKGLFRPMRTDRIEFISSYCDRWCERCSYTARCSTYAVEIAIGMCGDVKEALELALGTPRPARADEGPSDFGQEAARVTPTPAELPSVREARRRRGIDIDQTRLMRTAWQFTKASHQWIHSRYDEMANAGDAVDVVLREALALAVRDAAFITVKLKRALGSRERGDDDHPIQNDGNGSAKVALISIERSEAAWGVIAQATGDTLPLKLVELLRTLRQEVEREFPAAKHFIRPGFDEPGR